MTLFLILAKLVLQAQTIPLNPNVVYGKLDNGFTYYIQKNEKPAQRVELRLAINVGSILETEKQLGLAHFMEHMNFNGTKHFPGNQLVDTLQSIGVRFGQHLNAYTGFDETVYMLPVPLDKPENLNTAMKIIEDWAFNASLRDEDINKERGVILEELRLGLGADKRMLEEYLPKVLYKARYAERLPIGKKDIITSFNPEELRQFYRDWYRPDLMALVVVGDIDPQKMEAQIKTQFSKYKNPSNKKERIFYKVPNHSEPLVAVVADPEASFSRVELMYKDLGETDTINTEAEYRDQIIKSLFAHMLNSRLKELTKTENPPFSYAGAYHAETYARTKSAYQSYALTSEGGQLRALKVLAEENQRVKKFGFNPSELERAKTEVLSWIEKAYKDRDKTESKRKTNAYVNHFLKKSPAPGIDWEYAKYNEMISSIQLEEVNQLMPKYIKHKNVVVVITGPEKESIQQPSEEEVLKTLYSVDIAQLQPYEDHQKIEKLIENLPAKGSIVNTTQDDALKTTTWTLSNGAKVTFRSTDFKNDEILFRAIRLGGSTTLSDEVYNRTKWAYSALSEAGLNNYSPTEIEKYLAGKQVYVSPFFSEIQMGFSGQSTPADLSTLFELIYANFTHLNKNNEAYNAYASRQQNFFNNLALQPRYYFNIEHNKFVWQNNPRQDNIIPLTDDWQNTDFELAYDIFTQKLENAADFHFFFIGNIDATKLQELSEKYLAVLPAKGPKETYKDLGYRPISGTHKKMYKKGSDPKSFVEIVYRGETTYNEDEDLAMDALAEVIGIKLIEKLREDEGGTYTSSVSGGLRSIPYASYNFRVFFPCAPQNVDHLIQVAQAEIQKVIENGPDERDLEKFKEAEINEYNEKQDENRTWLNVVTSEYIKAGAKSRYLNFLERLENLTARDVQNVAQKYLTQDYIQAVLYPEDFDVNTTETTNETDVQITADKVVARYYDKIGGKENIENISSSKMVFDLVYSQEIEITMTSKGEDKFKLEAGKGRSNITTIVNGQEAYKLQAGRRKPVIPAEVENIKKQLPQQILLLPEMKNKVEVEMVQGRKHYILESKAYEFTFDAETGLLLLKKDKNTDDIHHYKQWQSFDGIMFPAEITLYLRNKEMQQRLKSLQFNQDISDTIFE